MTVRTKRQRRTPFLHRNWKKVVKSYPESTTMGNIVSSPVHKGSHQIDDEGAPPLKRRRISSPEALGMDHLIASPRTSDSRSALRIEVLRIFHKDSKKVRSYQANSVPRDVTTTKASCRVTITESTTGSSRVLHCQSQVCELTTFKNPVGPYRVARIDLPRPFFVPEESILINRAHDGQFGLADSYEIKIEFESAHDGQWPPLNSNDFGVAATHNASLVDSRRWVMQSQFNELYGRLKGPLSLSAGYASQKPARPTEYVMDVDFRWTAGFKALRRLEKGSMPCINAIDPDMDPFADDLFVPASNGMINGTNGHHLDESSLDVEEDGLDGAQTPSRSLRTREKNKVYNLKVLSDQAQGRERKRRTRGNISSIVEGRISYILPSDQPLCLDYYRCIACGAYHQTMLQLQIHLQALHPTYDYVLETTNQGPQFRVTSRCDSVSSPLKQYQLRLASQPFNLQTYAAGDPSWVTTRLGSEGIDDIFTFSKDRSVHERLPSHSPVATQVRPIQRHTERQKDGKILVPRIKQPLFDPISRSRLIPGEEIPKTVPDNRWLIQKHRESIGDFSDVTPAEKEYIWEWDAYILRQNLTAASYFPRHWLEFVKEKASWLVAADQRMLEFSKHTTALLGRKVLNPVIMHDASTYINAARAGLHQNSEQPCNSGLATEVTQKQSPKSAQIRKGMNGCTVCQLPVLGPRILVCSNKLCFRRIYHIDCAEKDASMPVNRREWRCNKCSGLDRAV